MCARPPLIELTADPEKILQERMDSPPLSAEPSGCSEPPVRAMSFAVESLTNGAVREPAFPDLLRSVKSGPAYMRQDFPHRFLLTPAESGTHTDHTCAAACAGSTACTSSPRGDDSASCATSDATKSPPDPCSKGAGCCRGSKQGDSPCNSKAACVSSSPTPAPSGVPVQTSTSLDGGNAARPLERARPIARVSGRKAVVKRKAEPVNADPSRPTFGDLEDLWRKDSEARNYCTFVCSAPTMCRSGPEGLVDPSPDLVDASRRKRMKSSSGKASGSVALVAECW